MAPCAACAMTLMYSSWSPLNYLGPSIRVAHVVIVRWKYHRYNWHERYIAAVSHRFGEVPRIIPSNSVIEELADRAKFPGEMCDCLYATMFLSLVRLRNRGKSEYP